MNETTRESLKLWAKVLLRCGILGFALLLISMGAILALGPTLHRFHEWLFGITAHEINVILYCFLGLMKIAVLVLFWIPWLAILWVLKSEKQ